MKIGAQLYTVRDFCRTKEDFSDTLKKVADIGYTTVQVSGTCEYEGEWLREELKKNGLSCVLTHYPVDKMLEYPEETCQKHLLFGCDRIGIGSVPGGVFDDDVYNDFAKKLRKIIDGFKPYGGRLYYHNHHMEFQRDSKGVLFLDRLLSDFSGEELGITFDTYWAQYAGANPAAVLAEKLAGRAECIHLKDMCVVNREQRMAPVGFGNMDFEAVFKAAEAANVKYMLVEQDNCYDESPFDALKKSYNYLKSKGFD